jgi:hypothetical protein
MAARRPLEGESYEQYVANQWADEDVKQRYPNPEARDAHLNALYAAGPEGDTNVQALSLASFKDEPTTPDDEPAQDDDATPDEATDNG